MPWFKVDDAFHGHPKVMELSPAAVGVWTLAGSWCANYLTDGEIKMNVVRRFGASDEMIRELVEAGLWIDVGGAYQFKDWAEYQPLKEEVEAERNAARERMKEVRARKKGVERSGEQPTNVQANNPGTFGGTSEEVRVTPTQSLSLSQSLPIPSLDDADTMRKTPLPKNWAPNASHIERAKEQGVDVIEQAEFFRLHAETHGRVAASWNAAFTTWLKKATPTKTKPAANSPWSKDFYK
jgi:hypothetical protein